MNNTFTWSPDELYHHGIKGQKWGIRRYQNPDGSLTEVGKRRYRNPVNLVTDLNKNIDRIDRIGKELNVVKKALQKAETKKVNSKEIQKYKQRYNRLNTQWMDEVYMHSIIESYAARDVVIKGNKNGKYSFAFLEDELKHNTIKR